MNTSQNTHNYSTKHGYLNTLESFLKALPYTERESILKHYSEMIDDLIEEGLEEEDAVSKLENPETLATILLEDFNLESKQPERSALTRMLLILGFPLWGSLVFAGFMLWISAYLVAGSLILIPIVTSAGLLFASVWGTIGLPFILSQEIHFVYLQVGGIFLCLGIGIPLLRLSVYLVKNCKPHLINNYGKYFAVIKRKAAHYFG